MKTFDKWNFLLLLALLSAFGACAESDKTRPGGDGDLDSEANPELEGETPFEDGDLDGVENLEGRELVEPEPFIWQDDTVGEWTPKSFCIPGTPNPSYLETFEDGELKTTPGWKLDTTDEAHPDGQSGIPWPVIVEPGGEDAAHGKVLSGDPIDLGVDKKAGRLYVDFPADQTNGWHAFSKLLRSGQKNALQLGNNLMLNSLWTRMIQVTHHAPEDETPPDAEKPYKIQVRDEAGQLQRACEGDTCGYCDLWVAKGWRRLELYRTGGDTWRLDLDRVTVCRFTHAMDRTLTTVFANVEGYLDDVFLGQCIMPDLGLACDQSQSCQEPYVCGRDGVCDKPRALTCQSDGMCKQMVSESIPCIGEKREEDLLGDGTCSVPCRHHADCLPSEVCLPRSQTEGSCQTRCNLGGWCPDGQSCFDIGEVKGCLPTNCKEHGRWKVRLSGLYECDCLEGYLENPFTKECAAYKTCTAGTDCSEAQVCAEGACYTNRQKACKGAVDCAGAASCYGFKIDEEIAGTGQCYYYCSSQEECLPYERCIPVTEAAWGCAQTCLADTDCPEQFACIEGPGGTYCLPDKCQENGVWKWDDFLKMFACACINGTRMNPVSGRCFH